MDAVEWRIDNFKRHLADAKDKRDRYEACLRGISLYVRTTGDLDHAQFKAICNAFGVDLA